MNFFDSLRNWSVYVVTDEHISPGRTHIEITRAAIAGGADVIQLRDKTAASRKLFEDAMEIRHLTWKARVPFIVNDRLDIALACNADGLHVGQADLPASVARQLLGEDKILGVSAETLEEALQAEKDGANYLGVGPIFEARSTKPDASQPIGLTLLTEIRRHTSLPIIAIGGINAANAMETISAGANGIAVISAVVAASDIQSATRRLKALVLSQGESIDYE
ncbi:thiamine phosphate synthase [candidate division KSB1 bacterium]|nr:thiamine phosphate synthase [candidate division KSB1 bacterium]